MDVRRNATMNPRYRRKGKNSVEKLMRPGLLLLALLIGFAFIYLLTPSSTVSTAMADQAEEEYASAEEPQDPEGYDDEEDHDANSDDDGDGTADDEIDDTADLNEDSYEDREGGEDYDDDSAPRPGDNEAEGEDATETIPGVLVEDEVDEDDGEETASEGRHRECIYVPGINSFHVIDDKHLTVSTSPRRIYLVTLWNRCFDLKWSHQIAIKSYSSWTCSHSRDTIITEDSRCFIDEIERVESNEAAENIVAERSREDDTE